MKRQRKTLVNYTAALMGMILLLSSCFAFATLYKCSKRGTISFSKRSNRSADCCCCKEMRQTLTAKAQVKFQCCHKIALESNSYTKLNTGNSIVPAAVIEPQLQSFSFIAGIKPVLPKHSAKMFSGVSPPVYLLKQSFLI